MRRIIHTFILAFQFIILPAVFTACKDDGGFKKSLPHSLGKRIHFCWKRITAGELPAFPTVLHLATLVKSASTTSHGTVVPVREKRQAVS